MYMWEMNEHFSGEYVDWRHIESSTNPEQSLAETLFEDPRSDPLSAFLLQTFITLILCKIFGKCLSLIHQPAVIGQILAGIIFGPSVMGIIPGFSSFVFSPHTLTTFQMVASMGLVFFMFTLGLRMDPHEISQSWKYTLPIASISIIIPVGIGCATSLWLLAMAPEGVNQASFILFVGSGIGFSAFPVLASILQSMKLIKQPIGILTISIAALEDIVVWVLLAVASAFSGGGSVLQGLFILLLTGLFVLIMLLIVRPLLSLLYNYYLRRDDPYNTYFIVVCLLVLIAAAFTTETIHIHAFFGAFIAGLVIPRRPKNGPVHEYLANRIELFIIEFFLPLYFTNSGLKTHLYLLNNGRAWYTLIAIVAIASISKIVPVALVTKLVTKKSWSYAIAVGILMNTRGIVQLAVLNIGVELGVLSPIIFAIFVLAAVLMTFATSPLVHLIYNKQQNRSEVRTRAIKVVNSPLFYQNIANTKTIMPLRKLRLAAPNLF